jgi:serine/threonine protein phosphatase PrpC
MQLEFAHATDPGLDPHKRVNEDACGHAETAVGHLFVVCDGMGGHSGGKQASDIALRTIVDHMSAAQPSEQPVRRLVGAIELAAKKVYEFGGPAGNPNRPGSTCVALLAHQGFLEVAHVGDSRAYAIRGKQIFRLTRDHSMVQEMIDGGVLTEQQAIGHPDSNKITRALGMTPEVEVETRDEPMELFDGDMFVLASDGLTDLARNEDILVTVSSYVKSANVQTACTELVALANRRGGHDNITVQLVRVLRAGHKLATTRVEEPALPGARAASPRTIVQAPVGHTNPGAPALATTLNEEPFQPAPSAGPAPQSAWTGPAAPMLDDGQRPRASTSEGQSALVYVVMAMALVIGLLAAALVYVLYFK